ncbi:hypothetical protein LTR37_015645 [Vermiconidia calcicola]|uniref:Uncharacterized protein n=1 Tax=Vermiconidia calcicola TaxID=1690605 RepID=A0ACC3MQH7_9PEZI|nr:hypothetical protein LTR37_015645 [Vermiconidia calcicola]
MSDDHANVAKQSKDENSGEANVTFDADSMPVLVLLGGEDVAQLDVDGLIHQILDSIQARRRSNPGMCTLGRTVDYFRIDYDPESTKFDGVQNRLYSLAGPEGITREFLDSMELLLRPFVSWNKADFPDIAHQALPLNLQRNEATHRQTWAHYPVEDRESLEPFGYPRRETIISRMAEMVRRRCEMIDPHSLLLVDPAELSQAMDTDAVEHARQWTLVGTCGRLAKEMEAIAKRRRPPEWYKDALERALYVFMINNPRAVLGRAAGERF